MLLIGTNCESCHLWLPPASKPPSKVQPTKLKSKRKEILHEWVGAIEGWRIYYLHYAVQFKKPLLVSFVLIVSASYENWIASASSLFLSFSVLFPSNLGCHYSSLKPCMESMLRSACNQTMPNAQSASAAVAVSCCPTEHQGVHTSASLTSPRPLRCWFLDVFSAINYTRKWLSLLYLQLRVLRAQKLLFFSP